MCWSTLLICFNYASFHWVSLQFNYFLIDLWSSEVNAAGSLSLSHTHVHGDTHRHNSSMHMHTNTIIVHTHTNTHTNTKVVHTHRHTNTIVVYSQSQPDTLLHIQYLHSPPYVIGQWKYIFFNCLYTRWMHFQFIVGDWSKKNKISK